MLMEVRFPPKTLGVQCLKEAMAMTIKEATAMFRVLRGGSCS